VPQKILLASDTIAANVAYPELAPDRARVARAIDAVGLSEVVGECPQGIETLVGEGGKGLSGGQAQRVMLARAHYHAGAFVLLMDEGTSALDPETEQLALDSLRAKAREGAVVIMIAHRPAGAAMSDEVLVLDRGQLVAAGATETVMTTEAFHRVFV
jgi:ATP-binding cassette subfamily C protein CydD